MRSAFLILLVLAVAGCANITPLPPHDCAVGSGNMVGCTPEQTGY